MQSGWRLMALLTATLGLGLSLVQSAGLPERLDWAPALWLSATGHGRHYVGAGPLAALLDVAPILACAVLARLQRDLPGFVWTAAAAGLFAASLVAWTLLVLPMIELMAGWPVSGPPSDFPLVRDQWETGHAAMAALKLAGFAALAWGQVVARRPARETGLAETPRRRLHLPSDRIFR
ncbi:DUF1772 domain-containing protein [Sphingosinicella terrae]|uniref:DUF1772 domain-containing protein n=1 Tax=Sphingosinicella terrae TaxID=2172047 RepID=UPI000E0DF9D8|nr:DUF1772 domain-containing protein [Sphingosinicella terrae]